MLRLLGCTLAAARGAVAADSGATRWEAAKLVGGFLGFDKQREAAEAPRGLQVIGGGFARTGTKSTEAALIKLGHKIYDTRSILECQHADRWVKAAQELRAGRDDEVRTLLSDMEARGYTATLDFPVNLFAKALADLRPQAKVLFTTRNLDNWYRSWRDINEVLGVFVCRPWSWLVDFRFTEPLSKAFGFEFIVARYPEHVARPLPWFERVHTLPSLDPPGSRERWIGWHEGTRRALVAAHGDRVLEFDVRQGWAPLLRFLEVDDETLAAQPFPRVNDFQSLKTVRKVMDGIALFLPLWLALVAYALKRLISTTRRKLKRA